MVTWLFPSRKVCHLDAFLDSPIFYFFNFRPQASPAKVLEHRTSILGPLTSICLSTMRYQNWDVLLFPDLSKIPFQEFKTSCSVVQDPGKLAILPSTAPVIRLKIHCTDRGIRVPHPTNEPASAAHSDLFRCWSFCRSRLPCFDSLLGESRNQPVHSESQEAFR
jgi:hypothetical protein